MVEQIFISLSEKYDSVVLVIEQTKDLETLAIEDLMGTIKTFEQRMNMRGEKTLESAFQSKINLSTSKPSRGRGTTREREVETHEVVEEAEVISKEKVMTQEDQPR